MDCIFCGIVEGNIPTNKVYEDDHFLAFLDINPINAGHTLLIPKNHTANIFDSDDAMNAKVYPLLKMIATAMKDSLNCDGVNILQSNGEAAGQVVFHSHIHIIPRYTMDGFSLENASTRKNISNDLLNSYAMMIREKIDSLK